MDQSFNRQELLRLCKQAEYFDYELSLEQLADNLDTACGHIADDSFEFTFNQLREYFLTHDLVNKLILRKLNDNIKRIYKDEQANRRIIIAQIKTLLAETCPYWIIKTDIKSFYESIERERIISKLHDDSMLSYQSMFLLKKIFENPILMAKKGVPRGLNISATLSEIYMRKFDKWLRSVDGVYYYARFVDDIVIFSNSLATCVNLISKLDTKLNELAHGLKINISKTQLYDGKTLKSLDITSGKAINQSKPLDYLGYSFKKENERSNAKESKLKITIADKKIKKIKTRIVSALLDYSKNKNFSLLEKRMKFLSGNYSIKKSEEHSDLKAGIFYNYPQVNELKVFNELNLYFRKALFSKTPNFGVKVSLSPTQKRKLLKYCFVAGFRNKVYDKFSFHEMHEIIRCW